MPAIGRPKKETGLLPKKTDEERPRLLPPSLLRSNQPVKQLQRAHYFIPGCVNLRGKIAPVRRGTDARRALLGWNQTERAKYGLAPFAAPARFRLR